ncbi:MAG TPA: UDP-N-acetylmuramoyl-L-alanyl-D-glutamate--2,6-diaminopimelate ligase, partial [Cyclobacteriaceae bacterium]|nr:UDP-N-acetylmuramoyl-L-alanyl-D-glutamate--2,6-diaminopimelate ligase [Cyclobacteriaceae bacterium]
MPLLKDILYKAPLLSTSGNMEREIRGISFDSRQVGRDHLFVAVRGTQTDGHRFIGMAVDRGASAIVCETIPDNPAGGISWVQVKDSQEALGIIASNFYNNPSRSIRVVAVTGTNGKTTTVTLLYNLFVKLGYATGLISTIHNRINSRVLSSTHTTPDPIQLNQLMSEMAAEGCTYCFMEASSHALEQRRMAGLKIQAGVFTNITHDHLDYHKTFDAYISAKKRLFDGLDRNAVALINADDRHGSVMVQNTAARVKTYSLKVPADFKTKIISNTFQGIELNMNDRVCWFPMVGEFNAYNLTAA